MNLLELNMVDSYPAGLPKLSNDSIGYCVGAGEDISHDIILSKRLNVHIIQHREL